MIYGPAQPSGSTPAAIAVCVHVSSVVVNVDLPSLKAKNIKNTVTARKRMVFITCFPVISIGNP